MAQDLDQAESALVRIAGEREGETVRGSGFVVGLAGDRAVIVTAEHVIAGVKPLTVSFAADLSTPFPAGAVLGMDLGNPRGVAVFEVRGALPAGVTALGFDTEAGLRRGEDLVVVGFPEHAKAPLTLRRSFAGLDGNFLQLDQSAGEGLSGAPVLRDGQVVGVVTDVLPQLTFALKALVVRDAVVGWGVKLGEVARPGAAPRAAEQPAAAAAKPPQPVVLTQGTPLSFLNAGVVLSVTFSPEHGGFATLRITVEGQPPVVEAVLGPGGQIPFRTRAGEHRVSVVDYRPDEKTLELMISPGL